MTRIRCCFCGRFMSDEDVLLGVQSDDEFKDLKYGHEECAVAKGVEVK